MPLQTTTRKDTRWTLINHTLSCPDLWFWCAYLLLNALLLLPYTLFNRVDNRLLPLPGVDLHSWRDLFIARGHIDLLRFNAELTLTMVLWALGVVRWHRKGRVWFWRILLGFYFFALVYKCYTGVLTGLYQMQPNFYNDIPFITGGLPFFLNAMELPGWFLIAFVTGITVLVALLWRGTRALLVDLPVGRLGWITRGLLVGIGAFVLVYGWQFRTKWSDPQMVVTSLTAQIAENVASSIETRHLVEAFDVSSPFRAYDYAQYTLRERPNVYFIVFESYGSALYTKDHFRNPYLEMLADFDETISTAGWYSTSTFSESPTWGGGTWIAYTNAMFGISVSEQSQYEALHETYQHIPYPNLGRYFSTQGYDYIWMAPIQRRISPDREAADRDFFGVDRFVTLEDMDYHGPLYGWGPSTPDQYTFGYIQDFIKEQEKPTFLFFITQNSHYPYIPLPPWMNDWRVFNKMAFIEQSAPPEPEGMQLFWEARGHYIDIMRYTFKVLGDFIATLDDPEAVIVLLGDHQPPAVSNRVDGYTTMLHIISKDETFLQGLREYGFTPGLVLENLEDHIAHEGFYSLFVRALVCRYGRTPEELPPYLPEGLGDSKP